MFLTFLFGAATPENPRFSLNDPAAWAEFAGGSAASSGMRVTRESALTDAAWWRGINLLSAGVGKLPLLVKKNGPTGKLNDPKHPAWFLLRRKPNEFQTAFQWKQLMVSHALPIGNGYSAIDRDGAARPLALLPLDPETVTPVRENGRLLYLVMVNGEARRVAAEDMFHLRGFNYDGLIGYSVHRKAAESLGLTLAARKYGAVFFRNDARPNVAVEVPRTLTEPQKQDLRKAWDTSGDGLERRHKIAILENGVKLQTFSIVAKDAQLHETRKFGAKEIALFLGVPPHKLGDSDKAAYNSLEQENQDHLDDGLDPWLVRIEEECWDKLLTEQEKADETHEVCFDRKKLIRADMTARSNYYQKATGNRPWMTPDEVREEEDLEARGEEADELKDPLNMAGPAPPTPEPPAAPPQRRQAPPPAQEQAEAQASALVPGIRYVVEDAALRAIRRLGNSAATAARKPEKFMAWLDAVSEDHGPAIVDMFGPSAVLVDGDAGVMARHVVTIVHGSLLEATNVVALDLATQVQANITKLEKTLPPQLADEYLAR
jgi:HK97 family phage portal protein